MLERVLHFPNQAAFCIRCRFRREICLCGEVRTVESDVSLLLVLHAVECLKKSNTGHLATLVLPGTRIAVHGWRQGPAVDLSELAETHDADGREWRTVLLYPGLGARMLTPEYIEELRGPAEGGPSRIRLVVPDGTWGQARRMVKRLPAMAVLPRVILPTQDGWAPRRGMRPRGNPEDERVSTCEAIASVYGLLGNPEAEAALFAVYDAAALRVALMRGKVPIDQHRHVIL